MQGEMLVDMFGISPYLRMWCDCPFVMLVLVDDESIRCVMHDAAGFQWQDALIILIEAYQF